MSGSDALQSVQCVTANGKRFAVLDADNWDTLLEWLETIENRHIVRKSFSPAEQDSIASIILDELADEARWSQAFARSEGALRQLANNVRADIQAGKMKRIGIDQL